MYSEFVMINNLLMREATRIGLVPACLSYDQELLLGHS